MDNQLTARRGDIEGLRAIAVGGVVINHFAAHWLPGGFVGVDVFFVISGFLISGILYREVGAGTFSYLRFIERRARRIFPAYFVVSLAVIGLAFLLFNPEQLASAARQLVASALFVANIHFYLTSDYFAPSAIELPFLHYWSLSVEEQFYLFFPFLALLLGRVRAGAALALLAVIAVVSVAVSQAWLAHDPQASFYLLPFRAFELAVGAIIAHPAFPRASARVGGIAGAVGVAGILSSMVLIGEGVAFPGLLALWPVLSTALVIWGLGAAQGGVAAALSVKPMLFVGGVSYALYLVHWPVVVFGRSLFPSMAEPAFVAGGIAVSVMLAWLVTRVVEEPVRSRRILASRRGMLGATAAGIALLAGSGGIIVANDGFSSRLSTDRAAILAFKKVDLVSIFRTRTCFGDKDQTADDMDIDGCFPGKPDTMLIWGDSHMAQYVTGMEPLVGRYGFDLAQLTYSACLPLLRIAAVDRPHCESFNDRVLAEINTKKPSVAIMGGYWKAETSELEALDRTIAEVAATGARIVVLGPGPIYNRAVPDIVADRVDAGLDPEWSGDELLADVLFQRDDAMKAHFAGRTDAGYVSVLDAVCRDRRCPLTAHGAPAHFDIAHFTAEGARRFSEAVLPLVMDAAQRR